jgi:hypothetical protein
VLLARRRLLRGDYLAIVTLGFGEIIRIFNNLNAPVNISNGPQGSTHRPVPNGSFSFARSETILGIPFSGPLYYYALPLLTIGVILVNVRLNPATRLGSDPRRRGCRQGDGHQHAQRQAAGVRDGRVVRRHRGCGLLATQQFVSPESFGLSSR